MLKVQWKNVSLLVPKWASKWIKKLPLLEIGFFQNCHFSGDILQKSTSRIRCYFFPFYWKNHQNRALAYTRSPKWHFRLLQKMSFFASRKCPNRALAYTRARFWPCSKSAKHLKQKLSTFGFLHFTMVKCTSRMPDASKMHKKWVLQSSLMAPSHLASQQASQPGRNGSKREKTTYIDYITMNW